MHVHQCQRICRIGIELRDIWDAAGAEADTFASYYDLCGIQYSIVKWMKWIQIIVNFQVLHAYTYLQANPAWCIARRPAVSCIMIDQMVDSGSSGPLFVRCMLLLWLQ